MSSFHNKIYYVTLIDGLAYITDFRKRHPTRASNRLATLYDVCKGRKYSKGNKIFLKVSGLAEAGVTQRKRESKGQRKKT